MSPEVRKVLLNQAELRTWIPLDWGSLLLPPAPNADCTRWIETKHSFVRKLVLVQLSTRASLAPASVRISHVAIVTIIVGVGKERKTGLACLSVRVALNLYLTHCLSCSAPEDRFASLAERWRLIEVCRLRTVRQPWWSARTSGVRHILEIGNVRCAATASATTRSVCCGHFRQACRVAYANADVRHSGCLAQRPLRACRAVRVLVYSELQCLCLDLLQFRCSEARCPWLPLRRTLPWCLSHPRSRLQRARRHCSRFRCTLWGCIVCKCSRPPLCRRRARAAIAAFAHPVMVFATTLLWDPPITRMPLLNASCTMFLLTLKFTHPVAPS